MRGVTVRDVMRSDVVSCGPDDPVRAAATLMREHGVGAVVIVDEGRRPIGMLTDRDIALRVVAAGRSGDQPVHAVMSHEPVSVGEDRTLVEATQQMAARECRRLPVVDAVDGRVIGLVSFDDILLHAGDTIEPAARLLAEERHGRTSLSSRLGRTRRP